MNTNEMFSKKVELIVKIIEDSKYNQFLKAFDQVCVLDENNNWVAVNTKKSLANYQRMLKKRMKKGR